MWAGLKAGRGRIFLETDLQKYYLTRHPILPTIIVLHPGLFW